MCYMCCLDVQLQALRIGDTTKSPDSGPLPQYWSDIVSIDQYWYLGIGIGDCKVWHRGQERVLQWVDDSPGNTFGVAVSEKGELHLYHNRRDVSSFRDITLRALKILSFFKRLTGKKGRRACLILFGTHCQELCMCKGQAKGASEFGG